MKKVIFIIPQHNFRDDELLEPMKVLNEAGISTSIASKNIGKIVGADGAEVQADLSVDDIHPNNFDAVIFIGGPGTVPLITDLDFIKIAQNFYQANKVTTAICAAAAILANANLLTGKNATSWSGVQKNLIDKGANWIDSPVVVDGSIITAQGPQAASKFGHALVSALNN